ncbi:MAG: guanylate kinase [Thermovirga sp.]
MNRIVKGHLFVISGPSGVGKGTLRKALFEIMDDLEYSISCTTRPPRNGEREGFDYRFVGRDHFGDLERDGKFLEWAEVHGNLYGTLKEDVERALLLGKDIVLEIDVQGALKVKEIMPEAVLIFILPPTKKDLEERLRRRGTEKSEELRIRLDDAMREIRLSAKYDHSVVNDDLGKALVVLKGIIESYRAPRENQ